MEADASPRFPPDDRIPDVPANDPIPSGELIDARYFLSGWTLARYTERFRIESGDGEASSADDLGDGATPVGSGAFGWTAEGPPGRRRARRRRPRGVLTIPTRATVGQALRDLAAADVLAAPAVDAAKGEYAGWISVGSLLEQILTTMYPALLDPEFVSQADVETYADELAPNSPAPRTKRDVIDAHASAHAEDAWRARVAPGDDGDACYLGFADTTLLDFVSRGLDNRPEKRVGDFDPSHRIAVFTEPESTDADGTARHSSSDDEDDARLPDMRPRWVSVVSQLDVLDLMVSDADALGSFPRTATMESLGFTRGTFAVAAVSSDFSAAGCFAVMHNLGVSGLAVVDRRGRFMIGSISASDVRRVSSAADLADALSSSVDLPAEPSATGSESLERLSESPTGDPAWRSRCVSVAPDASLLRALTVMSEARTHRAYVASSPNSRPVGVVTLTDVMRIFAVDSTAEEGDAGLTW